MVTQEEINQIAEQVEGLLKTQGKNISTAQIVETISNLTTIPAVDKNGNVVRVTLDAIKAYSEIKHTTIKDADSLNMMDHEGIYMVHRSNITGDVTGVLLVCWNYNKTQIITQKLWSVVSPEYINSDNPETYSGTKIYSYERSNEGIPSEFGDWKLVSGVLRSINLKELDNLGYDINSLGSYDIVTGNGNTVGLLSNAKTMDYNIQHITGQFVIGSSGDLYAGQEGEPCSFYRKRMSRSNPVGEWEPWKAYKPEIDTTPFVKTVEWKGITVKNVNVLQMSTIAPGEVVLLIDDDNNGISFVYEVMNNGIIPAYYGNWRGRENYQEGVYASGMVGFTAGFFDNTLYVTPDSIWMVNGELRLVNKTPAPVVIPDESGFIETTESQIDSLVTPGRHYKYESTSNLLNGTTKVTNYLSVYRYYVKNTQFGATVPESTAIIQERSTVSYSTTTGRATLNREIRSGYYINNVSELQWSAWKDATGTSSLETKITKLEAEVEKLKEAITAK